MIGKINGLMGMNAVEMMTDAEMDKILYDVFKKFDVDGSGTMELPDFNDTTVIDVDISESLGNLSVGAAEVQFLSPCDLELRKFHSSAAIDIEFLEHVVEDLVHFCVRHEFNGIHTCKCIDLANHLGHLGVLLGFQLFKSVSESFVLRCLLSC